MNQKELNELRRRWKPDKNAISRIYGCFVNSNKEIITDLDESLGMMTQEEAEKYLSLSRFFFVRDFHDMRCKYAKVLSIIHQQLNREPEDGDVFS